MRLPLALVTLGLSFCSSFSLNAESPPSRVLVRSGFSLGESFRGPSLTALDDGILRLELRDTHPASFAYIDMATGERLLGDPKNPLSAIVLDFDPALGISVESTGVGTWVAKEVESGKSLAVFDPEMSLREIKLDRTGQRAIAVGYDYRQVGLTVRAFDLSSGEEAWELIFPNTSSFELSKDRDVVCMFKEDTSLGSKHIELYDPLTGTWLMGVNLTEKGVQGNVSPIPAYSWNGLYAYLRQNSPAKTWLVDIENEKLTDLGMATPIMTSEDSLYAIDLLNNELRIVSFEQAEPIFTQVAGVTPPPVFLGTSGKAVYYDSAGGALMELDLGTGGAELFLDLPDGIETLARFHVSPDRRYAALIDDMDRIHLVDTLLGTSDVGDSPVRRAGFVYFGTESERFVLGDYFGNVASVSVDDATEVNQLAKESVAFVATSGSGDLFALFSSGRIEAYNGSTLDRTGVWELPFTPRTRYTTIASEASLITVESMDALQVLDYLTGETVFNYTFDPQAEGVLGATLSADGAFVAVESGSGVYPNVEFKLEVFRTSSSETVLAITEGALEIVDPVFSRDGSRLSFLKGLESNKLEVQTYSLTDGSLVSKTDPVSGGSELLLNGDGSAGYFLQGKVVQKVDLDSGTVSVFRDLSSIAPNSIQRFSLSSDESIIAVVDYNHDAVLYDLEKDELIARTPVEWVYNNEFISYDLDGALEVQADGSGLLFGNGDGSFRFWKLLDLKRGVPGSLSWSEGKLSACFPVSKGKAYRIEESNDLGTWTLEDPYDGGVAPVDGTEERGLSDLASQFIRVWEFE